MFTTKKQLIQRTGKSSIGRYDFLKLLTTEFRTTKSKEAKEQVLANLANFAYDPINYGYIRQLQIIDVFLHTLSEDNKKLVRFAAGGICNICLDPINKLYILRNQGIQLLTSLLPSQDEDVILSVITSLIFLITPESKSEITTEIIENIFILSKHENNRIKNLAVIFLNECTLTKDKTEISSNGEDITKMKVSKLFLELLRRYCTGPSNIVKNVKNENGISIIRTITNDDIFNFAKLTGDYNPIHVDSRNNIVHGAFLNGLVSGVLGTKVPGPGTIVVEQNLTFPASCYAGDTIEIKVQIVSVRKIIKCEYTCVANSERIVLQGNAKLIKKS